jgi:hypothetical protein
MVARPVEPMWGSQRIVSVPRFDGVATLLGLAVSPRAAPFAVPEAAVLSDALPVALAERIGRPRSRGAAVNGVSGPLRRPARADGERRGA